MPLNESKKLIMTIVSYRLMNCKACLDALTYFLYDARGAMGFSLAQAMLCKRARHE